MRLLGLVGAGLAALALVGCGGGTSAVDGELMIAFIAPPAGATASDSVFGDWIDDVYVVAEDGAERQRLTSEGGFLLDKEYFRGLWDRPVWSPDGSRVAASRRVEDELEIWVSDSSGDARRLVSDGIAPTWSPDGAYVAFMQSKGGDWGRVAVVPNSGGKERLLVEKGEVPRWSPAGPEILYWAPDPPGIRVVRVDGGEPRLVHKGDEHADWAPDGRRIAYAGGSGLLVSDANGDNPRTLSDLDIGGFAWSPDGSLIAFVEITYEHDWAGDLYVVSTNGGEAEKILSDVVGFPSWSPDGSRLAVARLETPGEIVRLNRVYVATVKPDGTGLESVTSGAFDLHPAWRPVATS